MHIVNQGIIDRLAQGRALWAGDHPPRSDMSDGRSLYDCKADFRLLPEDHQAFDLVFLVERDLSRMKQWPLVLDEALRAVRPGGLILVRMGGSALLSIFQLANFIERWTCGRYALIDQVSDAGGFVLVVKLTHTENRPCSPHDFSFALITDGRKPEAVAAFVDSVVSLIRPATCAAPEILVCGPPSVLTDLGGKSTLIRLIDQPDQFADLGWITRKKNLVAQSASRENVLIAHDRYRVPPDFLERIGQFGGDFDVIVPRQETVDGRPLPDWVMISEDLNWSTPGWLEFGDYHPFAYVNGGVIVAKTERVRRTRWSELLVWGQAEDVDLSRRLADAGVTPRPARTVRLISETPRTGFVEGFERLPFIPNLYAQTGRAVWADAPTAGPMGLAPVPTPHLPAERLIDLTGPEARVRAAEQGAVFESVWVPGPEGLTHASNEPAVLSLKLIGIDSSVTLILGLAHASVGRSISVRVNMTGPTMAVTTGSRLHVPVPRNAIFASNLVHVWLSPHDGEPLILTSVRVTRCPPAMTYQPGRSVAFCAGQEGANYLSTGWGPPEDWGVWSLAARAEVILCPNRALSVQAEVAADVLAFVPKGQPDQVVRLSVGGVRLGEWSLSSNRPRQTLRARIPSELHGTDLVISLEVGRLASPREMGVSLDDRRLGIGLVSLVINDGRAA